MVLLMRCVAKSRMMEPSLSMERPHAPNEASTRFVTFWESPNPTISGLLSDSALMVHLGAVPLSGPAYPIP